MIYTKPITQISWNDVELFCQQQIGEGAYLDYKENFPTRLEATISAMANTLGGVILIGVEENDDHKPKLPLKGITFQSGLSERVTSIILANITPPVFPEVQVCKNEIGDLAIVVIRIPQSPQAPHAIANNTKVYLRTSDVNKPEELATINQIGWLNDHRLRSVTLREELYQQAEKRYEAFCERVIQLLLSREVRTQEKKTGILTISACPTYPHEYFRNPPLLLEMYEKIVVRDYFGTSGYFPPNDRLSRGGRGTIVQDGVVFTSYTGEGARIFHTELNSHGLYFYRQPVRRNAADISNASKDRLSGSEILVRLDEFLDSASRYYQEVGYWGYVDFVVSLKEIREEGLCLDWLKSSFYEAPTGFSPDDEVEFSRTILAGNMHAEKDQLLFDGMRKLSWAFDIDLAPTHLELFFKKIKQ